ncbi:MAG: heavy-metal-associated domain-containing protein [Anaerolineales bacterium]|nr:heavy-metal-associated domain-containing protein [Anaerolineales bacterium]MCO5243120.1 heavy-metal-associated domain-containing protein [Anaerolineae bacterium]
MTTKTYTVPNISCGHCVATIERELKDVDGVQSVKANEQSKAVMVDVTSDSVLPAVTSMLAEIGYPASNA